MCRKELDAFVIAGQREPTIVCPFVVIFSVVCTLVILIKGVVCT